MLVVLFTILMPISDIQFQTSSRRRGLFCHWWQPAVSCCHYNDVIMGAIASQITSLAIVCSTVYPAADHRKHQSSASLAFVRGIHRRPVNSPHKWPLTRKMFPFDDAIMARHGPFYFMRSAIYIGYTRGRMNICTIDARKWRKHLFYYGDVRVWRP